MRKISLQLILSLLILANAIGQNSEINFHAFARNSITGETKSFQDLEMRLTPASALKGITLGIALKKLGSDFRFKTQLAIDGEIDDQGHLHGNLWILAEGDPSLGSRHIGSNLNKVLQWVAGVLRNNGIEHVHGDIVLDDGGWGTDVLSPGWIWEDIGNYYGAGAWGINIADNSVQLKFKKGNNGPVLDSVDPELEDIAWINELSYGKKGSGDQAYIYGVPFGKTRHIRGTLPVDMNVMVVKGSLPDAPRYFGEALVHYLCENGVEVAESRLGQKTANVKVLDVKESKPLSDLCEIALIKSDNVFVEAIVRRAFSDIEYKQFLKNLNGELQSVVSGGFNVMDACGLSPLNYLSSREMVDFYEKLHTELEPHLPEGVKTSIGKYLGKDYRIKVKSGYMSHVISYAGYAGDWTFCVMYNGREFKGSSVRKAMAEWLVRSGVVGK